MTNPHRCPYCQGESLFFVSSTDRNRHTTACIFYYYRCGECGLIFMDPIPPDLAPFYRGGYEVIPDALVELQRIARSERYRLDPILKYKQAGRLLDIGPWMGVFSLNAKEAGFEVTAIEQDQKCVDFLNQTVGVRALQSSDPAGWLAASEDEFDVIVLWHSLEHLRDPWTVIQQAANRLADGGILLVAIPNIDSFQYSALKAAWKHLDAPRHLFFYPIESLAKLCNASGLSTLELTTADELSGALSRDTWHSLANSLLPVRYLRGGLARVLRYATHQSERRENAGAGLTAIFQRPMHSAGRISLSTGANGVKSTLRAG